MRQIRRRPVQMYPPRGYRGGSTGQPAGRSLGGSALKMRVIMALVMAGFALFSYLGSAEVNEVTGERQYIGLQPHQEIAMGLQAAPQMVRQHGGLHPDERLQAQIDELGRKLVLSSEAKDTDWQYDFHLLADPQTVNAFALPGGQIFITDALFRRLETEGQVAGVLGHEIGHVVARHSAQRMAKARFMQGLTGAVAVATESARSAQMAQAIGQMVNMKYGREDELESDELGVDFHGGCGLRPAFHDQSDADFGGSERGAPSAGIPEHAPQS